MRFFSRRRIWLPATAAALLIGSAAHGQSGLGQMVPRLSDDWRERVDALAPERTRSTDTLAQLPDVMARVWSMNPQVQQAESLLIASDYDISAARTGYYPFARLSSALSDNTRSSNTTLTLVQPLWNGGRTKAEVDEAKALRSTAMAELAEVRLELGRRAVDAYLRVAQAQDQARLWSSYVATLNQLRGSIERRTEQGMATGADVQAAVARLRQAEVGVQSNRSALISGRSELYALMLVTPPAVAWPQPWQALSEGEIASAEQNIDLHPAVVRAEAEYRTEQATTRIAKASLWPELSVQHRRQLEGVVFDPTNDDVTLLNFSFQTDSGLRGFNATRGQAEREQAAKTRIYATQEDLRGQIRGQVAELRAVSAQLIAQAEAADASNALVESFERQYDVGRKTWLEVLNAHREAHDNRLQASAVEAAYWRANFTLALTLMHWERLSPQWLAANDPQAATTADDMPEASEEGAADDGPEGPVQTLPPPMPATESTEVSE